MLNYIKSWFNNSKPTQEEKSTIEVVSDIIDLYMPPKPLGELKGYDVQTWSGLDIVNITIEPGVSHKAFKDLGIKRILETTEYTYLGTVYSVDYIEYMSKFKLNYRGTYINDNLIPVYNFLKTTNTDISYMLNRFNLSLLTAYNMVVENRKINGGRETEEVFSLVADILDSFISLINERIADIETLSDKVRHQTNQSHTDFLRAELEYVNKFIKGEGMND